MQHFTYRTHVDPKTIEFIADCWEDGGVSFEKNGDRMFNVDGNTIAYAAVREIESGDSQLLIDALAGEEGISSSAEWIQFARWMSNEAGLDQETIQKILIANLAGQRYVNVARQLESLDWDGFYPVVDSNAVLTGEIADARYRYDLCDFDAEGNVVLSEHASTAMVLPQYLHTALCESCGERSRYNYHGYPCCGNTGCRSHLSVLHEPRATLSDAT